MSKKSQFIRKTYQLLCFLMVIFLFPINSSEAEPAIYNAQAAIEYAKAHATDTPEIPGNDCANFVSKCVSAGGIRVSQTIARNLRTALEPYALLISDLEITTVSGGYAYVPINGKNSQILSKGDVMFVCCKMCKQTGNNYERHAVLYSGESDANGYAKCYAHTGMANNKLFYVGYNGITACDNGHRLSYLAAEVVHFLSNTNIPEHICTKGVFIYHEAAHPHVNCYKCSICGETWRDMSSANYLSSCSECLNHIHSKDTFSFFEATHPHVNCYECSFCGEIWQDISTTNYLPSCSECLGHAHNKDSFVYYETSHPHVNCYECSFCGEIWRDVSSVNYLPSCIECLNHTHDKDTFVYYEAAHPHVNCYECSFCGETWRDTSSSNYLVSCSECLEHTHDKSTFLYHEAIHPHVYCYECSLCGEIWRDTSSSYYLPPCLECLNHSHDKGTFLYYEAAHPHAYCYECSFCGEIWRDYSTTTLLPSCSECMVEKNEYQISLHPGVENSNHTSFLAHYGESITLNPYAVSREGYQLAGWNLYRPADNTWFTLYHGWHTENSLSENGLQKNVYPPDVTIMLDDSWLSSCSESITSFIFYAIWEETEHSYSHIISNPPTISAPGTLSRICSRCNEVTTITLPNLNTTSYTFEVTVPATCTSTGIGTYTWKTTTYGTFNFETTIEVSHTYIHGVCEVCLDISSSIQTIRLPKGLKEIMDDAFTGTDTERIIIPKSVQVIGENAFSECPNLRVLEFLGEPQSIADSILEGCSDILIVSATGHSVKNWASARGYTVITPK